MIWLYIATVASIGYGIRRGTKVDRLDGIISGASAAVISFTAAVILMWAVGYFVYEPDHYSYSFEVMAAKDGSEINGQFGIFGGFIEEEPYYFFYRKYANGEIIQGKIRANSTSIYQDQETRAFIKVIKSRGHFNFWGLSPKDPTHYEIHVPEGSVTQDVEFDLE